MQIPTLNSEAQLDHVLSGNENAFSTHLQFWHFQIEFVIELVASNYHFGGKWDEQLMMSLPHPSQNILLRFDKTNRERERDSERQPRSWEQAIRRLYNYPQ